MNGRRGEGGGIANIEPWGRINEGETVRGEGTMRGKWKGEGEGGQSEVTRALTN